MTENKKRFTLRLPADLYQAIKASADKNKRSVAKEIEFVLSEQEANGAFQINSNKQK